MDHPALTLATVVLGGAWLTLAWLGVRAAPSSWRTWTGAAARRRGAVIALTIVALAARLLVAPATPEIRWRLAWAYREVGQPGLADVEKYGLAFPLFVRPFALLSGRSFDVVFPLNAVLGALCVPLMVALVRALGASDRAALWTGLSLACTPLLVWFAHTDSPFMVATAGMLLTFWGVAEAARDPDRRWLVVAVVGALTAAQARIEGVLTLLFAVALAALIAPASSWRRRDVWGAVAACVVLLLPHAALVGRRVVEQARARAAEREGVGSLTAAWEYLHDHWVVFDPSMQWGVLIAATGLGLLCREVRLPVRLWALVATLAMGLVLRGNNPHETAFTAARYQLHGLPYAALLSGLGLAWLSSLARSRVVDALLVVAVLAGLPMAGRETLLLTEHAFFRDHLPLVGSPCTVVTFLGNHDTTLFPPVHLSALDGFAHTWIDVADPVPEAGCRAYYASGMCTGHYLVGAPPRLPECAAFEARWQLEPLAEASLAPDPMGPMAVPVQRPDAPIPVGFYRIVGPR